METTTELRLAWRQEFASALLEEIADLRLRNTVFMGIDTYSTIDIINQFCESYKDTHEKHFDMRNLEFSVMARVIQRRLKRRGLKVVIKYLEMLEDCFTDCKVPAN